MMEFNRKLAAKGWLTMAWPKEYGGAGAGPMRAADLQRGDGYHRRARVGRHGRADGRPDADAARHGRAEADATCRDRSASADGGARASASRASGSDLASLQTRAVQTATTSSSTARRSGPPAPIVRLVLAGWCAPTPRRRSTAASRSCVDMKSPGSPIRPLTNMAGPAPFNQVFFDDVRIPRGEPGRAKNRGWYVMTGTLDHERATRSRTPA